MPTPAPRAPLLLPNPIIPHETANCANSLTSVGKLLVYPASVRFLRAQPQPPRNCSPGRKRFCRGLSDQSRRHLRRTLSKVDFPNSHAFFLRFSYPNWLDFNTASLSRSRERLRNRLSYHWGSDLLGCLWVLEHLPEQNPHYHLLVFLRPDSPVDHSIFGVWLAGVWFEVVGSGDLNHLQHGTHVEPLDTSSPGRIISSLTKSESFSFHAGKVWGKWGHIPLAEPKERLMPSEESVAAFCLQAQAYNPKSEYLSNISPKWSGFTVYATD